MSDPTTTPPSTAVGVATPPAIAERHPYFPVAPHKFVSMSLCTLGMYTVFWFYKNWERIARRSSVPISPFWRAFFAPFWGISLARQVHEQATLEGSRPQWSAGPLGSLYLVLSFVGWRLPDPWWMIALLAFLPLVPVVRTMQEVNAARLALEGDNRHYSVANMLGLIFGGLVLVLAIVGSFLPDVEPG
jgi:hypothetical protein